MAYNVVLNMRKFNFLFVEHSSPSRTVEYTSGIGMIDEKDIVAKL